ncbi:MAG TPA: ATP-binding cassette domain-containing protein [Terriglobales bacterium]|nr:ATP-binding cassette domain-containing protein [Terriglobales bacterium]
MLELKHISFAVADRPEPILDDVSFAVEKGKFTVITGPNGGGKSTIARLIMGIERPTAGRIFFEGQDVTDLKVHERAKLGIGYAFQQPPRFKGMTVANLLALASGGAMSDDACCEYLSQVGLCTRDYLRREVDSSLSGGEVKRIEIATLLARRLKLAIYDEPEAGIDLWSFSMLVDTFRRIAEKSGESVVLISHQERIIQLADNIVIIAGGKLRESGAKAEMLPKLMNEVEVSCGYSCMGGVAGV